MDVRQETEQNQNYIIERRRWYHSHPELSGKEINTIAQIETDLRVLGIEDIHRMKHCHGLYADIHGANPGRTLALRADIDALPIQEETGLSFASVTSGVMHACGHDGHISILLGAAKLLKSHESELFGNVRLIFQPSEEYPVGAKMMIEEGALEGVDAIYGNHVWGDMVAGKIDFSAGNRMATADIIRIRVQGTAAHGSAPHLGVDAVTVSAAIIRAVQQVVSRHNDPLNPMVVTIGKIDGGSRNNIICNEVFMEGTTRTFLKGTGMEDLLRPVIEGTAKALGAKVDFEFCYMTPAVINEDDEMNRIAREAVTKLYGSESLISYPPMMGGEDFSHYMLKVPGIYGFFGTHDDDGGYIYSNHQEKFTYDESVLVRASAVMSQFALDYLAHK